MGKFIPPLTPVDVRIGGRSFGGVGFLELPVRPLTSSPASRSDTSYSRNTNGVYSTCTVVIKLILCDQKAYLSYRLSEFSPRRVAGALGAAVGTSAFRLRMETVGEPNFFLVLTKCPFKKPYS